MKRRLFNAGAAFSSLLCVALILLGLRSVATSDWLYFQNDSGSIDLMSNDRHVVLSLGPPYQRPHGLAYDSSPPSEGILSVDREDRGHGFHLVRVGGEIWLTLPSWAAASLAALPGLVWIIVRRRPARHGDCKVCGYDLRGGEGRACPECGASMNRWNAEPSRQDHPR